MEHAVKAKFRFLSLFKILFCVCVYIYFFFRYPYCAEMESWKLSKRDRFVVV